MKSFLIGFAGGAAGPIGGFAANKGAEVALGFELAGTGLGLGGTNAGDGKPKPYIGNQQEAVKYYTQKDEKERFEKEIKNDKKKEEIDKMNLFIKQHSDDLISFYQFSSKKINNDTKLKMYKFTSHKMVDKKSFNNLQTQFTCRKDEPKINRIYVIRRKLNTLPFYFGWMAHSGILMNTKNNRWFICEYGVENDKNNVSLYEVTKSIKTSNIDSFEFNGRK